MLNIQYNQHQYCSNWSGAQPEKCFYFSASTLLCTVNVSHEVTPLHKFYFYILRLFLPKEVECLEELPLLWYMPCATNMYIHLQAAPTHRHIPPTLLARFGFEVFVSSWNEIEAVVTECGNQRSTKKIYKKWIKGK